MNCSCVGGRGLERRKMRVPGQGRRVSLAVTNAAEKATELKSMKGPLDRKVGRWLLSCVIPHATEKHRPEGWEEGCTDGEMVGGAPCLGR